MNYKRLGRTGLGVSSICLGTMGYGPPTEQEQVNEMIHTALDLGINFIDTADCYDGPNRSEKVEGYSEMMIGNSLKGGLRDEFVIITKAGVPMHSGEQHRGLSSTHLIREIDASLKRLKTDYVDVFMIHWPDVFADKEEVLRAINIIIMSGRARYFGISNHYAWEVCEYLWEADKRNFPKAGVIEIPFSILDRRYENDLTFYKKNEVGVICYQPLKGGLLSGKYKRNRGLEENSTKLIAGWTYEVSEDNYNKLEALEILSQELGLSLAEYAFAWDLAQPGVVSVINGARCKEELISSVKASEAIIPLEHFKEIDKIAPGPEKARIRFERYTGN